MGITDTIKGMTSQDYKERFKAEYNQLTKLNNTINQYHNKTLTFTLSCPIGLLEGQAEVMQRYKDILRLRAELEGINLD